MRAAENDLDDWIEHICSLGCAEVHNTIARLGSGDVPPELVGISSSQCRWILNELRSIMAVYESREKGAECKLNR